MKNPIMQVVGYMGSDAHDAIELKRFEAGIALMVEYQIRYGGSPIFVMTYVDPMTSTLYRMWVEHDVIDGIELHGFTTPDETKFDILAHLSNILKDETSEEKYGLETEVLERLIPHSVIVTNALTMSEMERMYDTPLPEERGWFWDDEIASFVLPFANVHDQYGEDSAEVVINDIPFDDFGELGDLDCEDDEECYEDGDDLDLYDDDGEFFNDEGEFDCDDVPEDVVSYNTR